MTQDRRLVMIKAGGGFITDKASAFTTRPLNIRSFAQQVAGVWASYAAKTDFIIGTGAGSYGHMTAHDYGLKDGSYSSEQFLGAALTHNSVVELCLNVAGALNDAKVPAFVMPPASSMTYESGKPRSIYAESLLQALRSGLVPVMHGDVILDSERGVSIVSTEDIFMQCLTVVRAYYSRIYVVYVMNEAGVLDSAGQVIKDLYPSDAITVQKDAQIDITGSIAHKIERARRMAATVEEVYIIGGKQGTELHDTLEGKTSGTRVY